VHHGAERAARLDLGDRCAAGHEDLARHTAMVGGERDRLGVVAGAAGRHAAGHRVAERGELVHRPTDLERARALQVLGFEHDAATEHL
jgi:hypothetical protein